MAQKKDDEKQTETPVKTAPQAKTLNTGLEELLKPLINKFSKDDKDSSVLKGLYNLNKIAEFGSNLPPVKGSDFSEGVVGLRSSRKGLVLTIACGKSMVRFIPLRKFIAMVEHMLDPVSATIVLENFKVSDNNQSARGQLLARINPESSAISIIQGVTGRVVRGAKDVALFDNYYIDRSDLTAFYLAAKAQISNEDTLEEMIQAYDGWKAFDVPLNPSNPNK